MRIISALFIGLVLMGCTPKAGTLVSKKPNGGYTGGYTGFKDELVNWGQGIDVYRHVTASLGLSLQGNLLLVAGQTIFSDGFQYVVKGRAESLAEINGNIAGVLIAPAFGLFFAPLVGGDSERLRNSLIDALCVK